MSRMAALLLAVLLTACEGTLLQPPSGEPISRQPEAPRADPAVYAALPFRNLTAQDDAPLALLSRLEAILGDRGARFVPPDELEQILRRRRIRYTDSLSIGDARLIAGDTGARWILLGTVLTWEPEPEPHIAILMRVLDARSGDRVASRLVSLAGRDFEGLLGLGTITSSADLADETAARLAGSFAPDGAPLAMEIDRDALLRDMPFDVFTRFLAPDFDPTSVERVAVLPLSNRTRRGDSGILFAEMLAHQWFTSTATVVVERSELVEAITREDVRAIEQLDLDVLRRIGRSLGTRYFVSGSIDRFGDDAWVGGRVYPEVKAIVWVLDVERGNVVAAAGLRRLGDHYHTVLGLGVVRDPMTLADRAARELVAVVGG
jgi:TolB-like protein